MSYLESNTTLGLVIPDPYGKQVILTEESTNFNPTQGRLVYLKANGDGGYFRIFSGSLNVLINPIGYIEPGIPLPAGVTPIQNMGCVTLLENPKNTYTLVNLYDGISGATIPLTDIPSGITVVTANINSSILFVDTTTESKVVLLPPIPSYTSDTSISAHLYVKDVALNAGTNPIYLSTSGAGETFDRIDGNSGVPYIPILLSNGSAIELACAKGFNQWYTLSAL